jgi:hypothetical protein
MSAIKNGGLYPITLDKERHLLFSLDMLDELEDEIGDISKLAEHVNGKGRMKFIRWLLTKLLNEGAKTKAFIETGKEDGAETLTERQVGLLVHIGNFKRVVDEVFSAFSIAHKGNTDPPENDGGEDENEDEGNATAGEVE